ncbi:NAD(P)/FAD-dependent oxidoreductase [Porticoccus sp.]|uniref:flavin-containing monooxygenase n=1 Tax=Porticoccus sp. TaxID=2024853 RepID=UPI0025DFDF31|nr:NAD(P)/FAD-dependent oxidoreductase [Porticoccus sp.]
MPKQDVDVLIIGAGLSGIGMACHLARQLPNRRIMLLERRDAIGGTWDLFRYPGVRSDSDMFTMGYDFQPWMRPEILAEGSVIRDYISRTAKQYGVDQHIHFGLKVTAADWSSSRSQWTVTALNETTGDIASYRCHFLISCAGYYNYDAGYSPEFPGIESFKGMCIHPQFWPESLNYRDKKVVVIGSGATAATIVPAMAQDVAQITLLQRSPSYYLSTPRYDNLIKLLEKILPQQWLYHTLRSANTFLQRLLYKSAIRWPEKMRKYLLWKVKKSLGKSADMRHFTPHYPPWQERLCVVPGGDLFKAIKSGKARIITDQIDHFTERGIQLKSGQSLDADIVITATGLQLQTFGGTTLSIDNRTIPANSLLSYKSVLLQNLPNMAFILGYTNASWTLKSDIASRYICRLLQYMESNNITTVTPRAPDNEATEENVMNVLSSGYILRGKDQLPRQGRHAPWQVSHSLEADRAMLLSDPINDQLLEFTAR